jgi:cytochrome c peroxidase
MRLNNKKYLTVVGLFILSLMTIEACKKDTINALDQAPPTTPYTPPSIRFFRAMPQDPANPMTLEGIALGKKLFFDPILSRDSTLSCAGCHKQANAFSDSRALSVGIDSIPGTRNAMALVNLAWYQNKFFWDGRVNTLRAQASLPIEAADEMHLPLVQAEQRLQRHPVYKDLFWKAFGAKTITVDLITKAIEQYEQTLISYNAPYDKYTRDEAILSASELRGLVIFNTERGDCFHCHTTPELFVHPTKIFSNNGMDAAATVYDFVDPGAGRVTGDTADYGKFKIPTLRNLAFTAPYMHDGRFATLDEVIESYNQGPKLSPTVDPILIEKAQTRLRNTGVWGLQLSAQDKADLKAFLLTFTDSSYVR